MPPTPTAVPPPKRFFWSGLAGTYSGERDIRDEVNKKKTSREKGRKAERERERGRGRGVARISVYMVHTPAYLLS